MRAKFLRPKSFRGWLVAILTALLLVAFADYWIYPVISKPSGKVVNLDQNGIWLRYTWYFGDHRTDELPILARRLTEHGIRDAFFHVRSLDGQGKLKFAYPEKARALTRDLKRLAPNVRSIAWVYVGKETTDLSDPKVRAAVVREAAWLVNECGFDGVQWDYEICPDHDPNLLKLLEETRAAFPSGKAISVAAPAYYPPPFTSAGWSEDYYREVARRCDQIAVMAYDTGVYFPRAYVGLVTQQFTRVCAAADGTWCKVLIGLPTYEEGGRSHNPRTENLRLALFGVRNGLAHGVPEAWQGVALFADYTTDDSEWAEFKALWK